MLDCYMGQCAPDAAFLPVTSLNSSLDVTASFGCAEIIDTLEDFHPNPEEQCVEHELAIKIREFVTTLPENLRDTAIRHYWLGQTQTEIAEANGVTRSNVCHAVKKISFLGRKFFNISVH